jgi:hypothetical protein
VSPARWRPWLLLAVVLGSALALAALLVGLRARHSVGIQPLAPEPG